MYIQCQPVGNLGRTHWHSHVEYDCKHVVVIDGIQREFWFGIGA